MNLKQIWYSSRNQGVSFRAIYGGAEKNGASPARARALHLHILRDEKRRRSRRRKGGHLMRWHLTRSMPIKTFFCQEVGSNNRCIGVIRTCVIGYIIWNHERRKSFSSAWGWKLFLEIWCAPLITGSSVCRRGQCRKILSPRLWQELTEPIRALLPSVYKWIYRLCWLFPFRLIRDSSWRHCSATARKHNSVDCQKKFFRGLTTLRTR